MAEGNYSWGSMKETLFEQIKIRFKDARERYLEFSNDTAYVDNALKDGATKAQEQASELMAKVRKAVGF